jgi:hypothetical protein
MTQRDSSKRYLIPVCAALAALATGCAPKSYNTVLADVENLHKLMTLIAPPSKPAKPKGPEPGPTQPYEVPPEADGSKRPFMEMPRLKARFCVQRAIEDYESSRTSTGADMTMLILAGLAGGIGSTMGATSAAMPDTYGQKKDLGIASVSLLAGAGAVLGLRAALNLNEVGRTQRVAAARSVNTAITILERYALTDDPKAVGDDGFGTCRDEDVNIANAFPGANSAAAIEQLITKAKENEKQASEDAAAAKSAETKTANLASSSRTKASDLKKKVESLQVNVESLRDRKVAPAEVNKKAGDLEQAQKDLKQAEADAAQRDAEALKAKIDAAKADLTAAQAELETIRTSVPQAGGRLRRAVFYLTAKDVELANKALDAAIKNVDTAKERVDTLQQRVDDLRNTQGQHEAAKKDTK